MASHLVLSQEVAGSIPVRSTHSLVAQLEARRPVKAMVAGSSPARGARWREVKTTLKIGEGPQPSCQHHAVEMLWPHPCLPNKSPEFDSQSPHARGCSSVAERDVANVEAAGSCPVIHSMARWPRGQARGCRPRMTGIRLPPGSPLHTPSKLTWQSSGFVNRRQRVRSSPAAPTKVP